MIDLSVRFDNIFNFTYKLYNVILASAYLLWEWFSAPVDESIVEFVGLPPSTTNIEMIFGSILIMSLVMAAVKLFNFLA